MGELVTPVDSVGQKAKSETQRRAEADFFLKKNKEYADLAERLRVEAARFGAIKEKLADHAKEKGTSAAKTRATHADYSYETIKAEWVKAEDARDKALAAANALKDGHK
jgi:hypothetical protein